MPRTLHIGLVCSSEQNADRFYGDLLGLTRQERKTIPVSIVKPLFDLEEPLPTLNYIGAGLHVELFLIDGHPGNNDRLTHTCLEVKDLNQLLEKAASLECTVTRIPRGDGWIVFFDDFDGNRFEIKERVVNR